MDSFLSFYQYTYVTVLVTKNTYCQTHLSICMYFVDKPQFSYKLNFYVSLENDN